MIMKKDEVVGEDIIQHIIYNHTRRREAGGGRREGRGGEGRQTPCKCGMAGHATHRGVGHDTYDEGRVGCLQ